MTKLLGHFDRGCCAHADVYPMIMCVGTITYPDSLLAAFSRPWKTTEWKAQKESLISAPKVLRQNMMPPSANGSSTSLRCEFLTSADVRQPLHSFAEALDCCTPQLLFSFETGAS